jgi:hypothetical protein
MKRSLISLAVLASLAGCGTFGHSSYSVSAVKDKDGAVAGYDLAVTDGKEFAGRRIDFQAVGPMVTISIIEGASKAFKGQALGVKAINILPTMGLDAILAPRGE